VLLSSRISLLGHWPWQFRFGGPRGRQVLLSSRISLLLGHWPWQFNSGPRWKSWAPSKCKTFIWLAIRNRCWTADRLQKRGLPHPVRCPFSDQADETVQHLLTSCVFARQFWFSVLQPLNLAHLMPSRTISSFAEWWRRSWKKIPKQLKKGFNSMCILGAWTLWKHRHACVFDGVSPNLQQALHNYKGEFQLWQFSGAKGLAALVSGRALTQT